LLIKYIKSVLWRVAKRLSYIEEARCLKVKLEFPVQYVPKMIYSEFSFPVFSLESTWLNT